MTPLPPPCAGMNESKLRIVPIAVNTTLFDPELTVPLKLPIGDLVFGRSRHFSLPEPMVTNEGLTFTKLFNYL